MSDVREDALAPLAMKINEDYAAMTPTEQRIADRILNAPDTIIWQSITEVGDSIGVSTASVIRFCQKLGLAGFQELKLRLALERAQGSEATAVPPAPESDLARMLRRTSERHQRAIAGGPKLAQDESLRSATDLLLTAKRIYCIGTGASQFTAMDAAHQFLRLGFAAEAFGDTHLQAVAASTLGPDDVAVVLTVSGATKDTLAAASIARDAGARVISVTGHGRTPIAAVSEVVLVAPSEVGPMDGGALSGKISQLVALDLLVTSLTCAMQTQSRRARTRAAQAVLDKLL